MTLIQNGYQHHSHSSIFKISKKISMLERKNPCYYNYYLAAPTGVIYFHLRKKIPITLSKNRMENFEKPFSQNSKRHIPFSFFNFSLEINKTHCTKATGLNMLCNLFWPRLCKFSAQTTPQLNMRVANIFCTESHPLGSWVAANIILRQTGLQPLLLDKVILNR